MQQHFEVSNLGNSYTQVQGNPTCLLREGNFKKWRRMFNPSSCADSFSLFCLPKRIPGMCLRCNSCLECPIWGKRGGRKQQWERVKHSVLPHSKSFPSMLLWWVLDLRCSCIFLSNSIYALLTPWQPCHVLSFICWASCMYFVNPWLALVQKPASLIQLQSRNMSCGSQKLLGASPPHVAVATTKSNIQITSLASNIHKDVCAADQEYWIELNSF